MPQPRIGLLTVAVPPFVGGMSTWFDRVARALVSVAEVRLFALTHDPMPQAYANAPYAVSFIQERLRYPRWMGDTLPKAIRWTRLFARAGIQAPELARLDLLITDATPGVVSLGARLAARHGYPWAVLMGGDTFFETRHQLASGLRHRWLARGLRRADAVIVDGDDLRDTLLAHRVERQRVHLAPHGIDTDVFSPQASLDAWRALAAEHKIKPGGKYLVTYHGRLGPDNGVLSLPALLEGLPDVRGAALGPGPQEDALRQEIARTGAEWTIMGRVPTPALAGALAAADVCVYPFAHKAGVPIAILEAMASGKPVLATRVGDIATIIRHGESGWLTAVGDHAGLRAGLETLLADADLRARLGEAARRLVLERHDAKHVATFYQDLAQRILDEA